MAAFLDNSSLDVSERNSMAITLNIHTKSHTVCGTPTLKLVEHFGNGWIRELYRDQFTSDPLRVNLLSRNIELTPRLPNVRWKFIYSLSGKFHQLSS